MSAVSADAPESAADRTVPVSGRSSAKAASPPPANSAGTDFGPNEWLVDELYQRYQADPGSVDRAWWNFFADYHPRPVEHPPAADPARPAPAGPPGPAPAPPAPGADPSAPAASLGASRAGHANHVGHADRTRGTGHAGRARRR